MDPASPLSQDTIIMTAKNRTAKSLKSWIWGAACSIRGARDAPKYKDHTVFTTKQSVLPADRLKRLSNTV